MPSVVIWHARGGYRYGHDISFMYKPIVESLVAGLSGRSISVLDPTAVAVSNALSSTPAARTQSIRIQTVVGTDRMELRTRLLSSWRRETGALTDSNTGALLGNGHPPHRMGRWPRAPTLRAPGLCPMTNLLTGAVGASHQKAHQKASTPVIGSSGSATWVQPRFRGAS